MRDSDQSCVRFRTHCRWLSRIFSIAAECSVFEHLERHRHTSDVKIGANGWAHVHERLQQVLAELIADHLRRELPLRGKTPPLIPPDLLAHYVASTVFLTLTWWVESRSPLPSNEINDLFRSLIVPSLAAILD